MTMSNQDQGQSGRKAPGLKVGDYFLLWGALAFWIVLFVIGILVNSEPYRNRIMGLEAPLYPDLALDGLIVILSYTLTNVALLCIVAAILGTLGRCAQLSHDEACRPARDTVNPRCSAVLRGFVVYLALISGVLVFGENPAEPTQTQYVRLAGFASLLSFVVNWNPELFANLLKRFADAARDRAGQDRSESETSLDDANRK